MFTVVFCVLAQINAQKMNFFVKNLFNKREHIRIKLRIYSHLLNKSLTENFIFCVMNIIGFTTEPCKFFFTPNCKSLIYFTSINTWDRLVSSLLFWNQFLACSKGLELLAQELLHDEQYILERRTFSKLPLVEEVPINLLVNCLPKQILDTIRRGIQYHH